MSVDKLPLIPKKSAIADFPTELLLIIFRFIYLSITTPCYDECHVCDFISPKKHRLWPEDIRLKPGALFPHDTARVCKHWQAVLAAEPEFWARLVVFIDSEEVPDMKSYLQLSSPFPVDAIIKRRYETRQRISTDTERRRMGSIVEAIRPEFDRFHHLWILNVHRDSIALVLSNIGETSEMLQTIVLEPDLTTISEEDNVVDELGSTRLHKPLYCPNLFSLVVDGQNFNILNQDRGGDFTAGAAVDPIDAINGMDRQHSLHLKRIKLPQESMIHVAHLRVDYVTLEELSSETVETFLRRTNLFQLHTFELCHCEIDPKQELPDCWTIIFGSIPSNPRNSSIHFGNLAPWRGTELKFSCHDGFNDDFLRMLGTPGADGTMPCGNVRRLVVDNCKGFSIAAMKGMILKRMEFVSVGTLHDTSIVSLAVTAEYLPNEEDVSWFLGHVDQFSWLLTARCMMDHFKL
ncbi:hypothetical protein BDQ17DRAFT_785709 [Cyathus striatus]|nr:hypothetical protein BDQ17DRAFT_785709 [Cyathus striatus]